MATAQPERISPPQSASYTSDMLKILQKIAAEQGHSMLAHLLGLARLEAKSLTGQEPGSHEPGGP